MRGLAGLLGCVAVAGCYQVQPPPRPELTSFKVAVNGVYQHRAEPAEGLVQFGDPGVPHPVVTECAKRYDGEANVPAEERGTLSCRYALPRGMSNPPSNAPCPLPNSSAVAEFEIEVVAIGRDGQPLPTFSGPVSVRVVPGDLTGKPEYRWLQMKNGVGKAVVKTAHVFSDVRIWVEDAPPQPSYLDGEPDLTGLPGEPKVRTFASGITEPTWFEDPTLQTLQLPDGFDNKCSPFVGQFMTVGRPPESGSILRQSCPDDPENDGRDAMLVVTGTDPSGFFVTDITACRLNELLRSDDGATHVRVPEPSGKQPGTFGSIFVYNYSFPEGLDPGDLLWSLSGSVQEFTSTSQLTFPSWTVRERVRSGPESEWNKYLKRVPIPEISLRTCHLDNNVNLFVTDDLCGQNRRNLKLESLESALVKVRNVRFPQVFAHCDQDGDGSVPFFCETRADDGTWSWGDCGAIGGSPSTLTPVQLEELACNIDCVTSQGPYSGTLCAERTTYNGFGQYVMELAGPGPREALLDDSLPARIEKRPVTLASVRHPREYPQGAEVRVYCNTPVRYRVGGADVVADATDPLLPANTRLDHVMTEGQSHLAFLGEAPLAPEALCQIGRNPRTRINVLTRDAVPELLPDCDPQHPEPVRASECRNLRGATYDVIGHLRQLQPGRPRWVVQPRDKDDICCRPGEGLSCPKPLQQCESS
jgi:hypothetical protein